MTQSLEEQVAHLQLMLNVMSCRIQDLETDLRIKIQDLADKVSTESIDKGSMSKLVNGLLSNRMDQVDQFQNEDKDLASPNDDIFIGRGGY